MFVTLLLMTFKYLSLFYLNLTSFRIQIFGNLPNVSVAISDKRLTQLLELLMSIPKPNFDEGELDLNVKIPTGNIKDRAKIKAIMDIKEIKEIDEDSKEKKKKLVEKTHRKNLVYEFKLGEVSTLLYSQNPEFLVGFFYMHNIIF